MAQRKRKEWKAYLANIQQIFISTNHINIQTILGYFSKTENHVYNVFDFLLEIRQHKFSGELKIILMSLLQCSWNGTFFNILA